MREIKYRGKRPNSNKWIYGSLYVEGSFGYILHPEHFRSPECSCEVLLKTTGQYTGINDSKNNEVFEGDIISVSGSLKVVLFENGCFYTMSNENDSKYRLGGWKLDSFIIVGNIIDNPELVKP